MSGQLPITVTDTAANKFADALEAEGLDGYGIRVLAQRREGGRIMYGLDFVDADSIKPTDHKLQFERVWVVIDSAAADLIAGTSVDYVERADGAGFKFDNPNAVRGWTDPVAGRLQELIDNSINPSIAAHGGAVELVSIKSGTAYLKMLGGCQGCGMAAVTLRQGIEKQVLSTIPEIERISDVTDHAAGENPYY